MEPGRGHWWPCCHLSSLHGTEGTAPPGWRWHLGNREHGAGGCGQADRPDTRVLWGGVGAERLSWSVHGARLGPPSSESLPQFPCCGGKPWHFIGIVGMWGWIWLLLLWSWRQQQSQPCPGCGSREGREEGAQQPPPPVASEGRKKGGKQLHAARGAQPLHRASAPPPPLPSRGSGKKISVREDMVRARWIFVFSGVCCDA